MKTKKKKKKTKLRLNVPRTLVFILFIYILVYVCYSFYKQSVTHYEISGNTLYSDAEILEEIGLNMITVILLILIIFKMKLIII